MQGCAKTVTLQSVSAMHSLVHVLPNTQAIVHTRSSARLCILKAEISAGDSAVLCDRASLLGLSSHMTAAASAGLLGF